VGGGRVDEGKVGRRKGVEGIAGVEVEGKMEDRKCEGEGEDGEEREGIDRRATNRYEKEM